jgi:hypothetical protein
MSLDVHHVCGRAAPRRQVQPCKRLCARAHRGTAAELDTASVAHDEGLLNQVLSVKFHITTLTVTDT